MQNLWRRNIAPFLSRFNHHSVCWGGIISGSLATVAIGARAPLDAWATIHLGHVAGIARASIDGAASVGMYAIWPALIASALGRPPNIPGGSTSPK